MKTYHIEFDDGSVRDYYSDSAGNAIQEAIWDYRGRTVKRCFVGELAQDAKFDPGVRVGQPAKTEFDVPPHEAVSAEAKQPCRRRVDLTERMPFWEEATS